MAIPCMILEAVLDDRTPEQDWKYQAAELRAFGDARAEKLGASGISNDFIIGFELARRSCRLSLRMSPPAAQAGIKAEEMF